jgi:hypothetical protein
MPRSFFSAPRRSTTARKTKRNRRAGVSHRRLPCESLEPRRLLSAGDPKLELFSASPALFVENQGQWADESARYFHHGDGVNVAMTDAGPVLQLLMREPVEGATDPNDAHAGSEEFAVPYPLAELDSPEGYVDDYDGGSDVVSTGRTRSLRTTRRRP